MIKIARTNLELGKDYITVAFSDEHAAAADHAMLSSLIEAVEKNANLLITTTNKGVILDALRHERDDKLQMLEEYLEKNNPATP